jgi:RNA polymerase sigma factor (sigma-70 family)
VSAVNDRAPIKPDWIDRSSIRNFPARQLQLQRLEIDNLVAHLFRHESGKLTAVLTRIFGAHNLELAEDVVQDSLLEAMTVWEYKGMPENPTAWLYKVAKNKALNIVNREKYKRQYSAETAHFLRSEWTANAALENLFSEEEIQDDQLRMMFTCCHASISNDSQVALILKTLCGFSIAEIAKAFLTTEETVTRRLKRARQTIRENSVAFEVPAGPALDSRLDAILQAVYLLFNEGYSASKGTDVIRYELCAEAIRLAEIIASHPAIANKSTVFAALALMYLNASRFNARLNPQGEIVTMAAQDRTLWDKKIMQTGFYYLEQASRDRVVSNYHLLAAISAYHCSAPDFEATDWPGILSIYDKLLQLDASPLVRLNRSIALAKVHGAKAAIEDLMTLRDHPSLKAYHLYHSTLAEHYAQLGNYKEAAGWLTQAIDLTPLQAEKDLLRKKLAQCREKM